MRRDTFPVYQTSSRSHYLIVWGMQWQMLECTRLAPGTDLRSAMTATIERLRGEAWEAEGTAEYGFVFLRRGTDRRLLMLTSRDPESTALQSFSPFR